jgi:hypothetical protein
VELRIDPAVNPGRTHPALDAALGVDVEETIVEWCGLRRQPHEFFWRLLDMAPAALSDCAIPHRMVRNRRRGVSPSL